VTKKTRHSYIDWDDVNPQPTPSWSTGNPFTDWATGCGGIPMGRVTETFGPESSGKSTLGLQTAAHVWHTYGIPSTLYDFEDVFDAVYAKMLGLTKEGLHLEQPNTLEEFFGMIDEDLDKSERGKPVTALSIMDSVASARTIDDIKNAATDNRTAGMNRARLWTQFLAANVHRLAETGMTLFLVNQLRDYIDTDPGFKPPGVVAMQPKNRTPGGRGIKFYSSLRIAFEQSSEIRVDTVNPLTREAEKMVVGKNVWLKVVKNKVAPPPWRKVRLQIRDGIGFDLVQNLLDFAVVHDILTRKAGVWEGLGYEARAQEGKSGDQVMASLVRSDPFLAQTLVAAVTTKLAEVEAQLSVTLQEAVMADRIDEEDIGEQMAAAPDVPPLVAPNGVGGNVTASTE
jgi:recombination protein RecA